MICPATPSRTCLFIFYKSINRSHNDDGHHYLVVDDRSTHIYQMTLDIYKYGQDHDMRYSCNNNKTLYIDIA
ncbi:hypothetical protein DERF_011367 [Dermatophagoides farinae]|uniref:Uncharacterized protein n=1 Tax=Dermatophagoides farinae TaxID=6954 RepID=A0A922HUE7_DERFA|nr:hypothetical protein DERF_011367 [Dermatophagoides farinae]